MEFLMAIPATLFLIYQSICGLAIINLPVVSFGASSAFALVAKLVVIKWGIILGIFGFIYAIVGYFANKQAMNTKMSSTAIGLTIFYYVLCFISVL